MKILLLILLSFNSYAQDCVNCGPELEVNNGLEKTVQSLLSTVETNCSDVLKQDTDEEYKSQFSGPKKSAVIKGKKLEGTQDELNYLKKMIGEKPVVDWNAKTADCSTVLCALTKSYDSETTAKRVLNIAKRNGYIVSMEKEFTDENNRDIGQLFSSAEIEDIDLAYKKLPPNFRKLKTLDVLKRMPKGYSKHGGTTAAYARPGYHSSYYSDEGEIVFMDKAFSTDKSWGPMVAIHELTHHLDFSRSDKSPYGFSESAEFLKLSGWKKTKEYVTDKNGKKTLEESWKSAPGKKFVRDYAGTEPAEDFAEAVAYYIYQPVKLRNLDPEKYEFVKNKIFAGKEFDRELDLKKSPEELWKVCQEKSQRMLVQGFGFEYDYFNGCLKDYLKDFKATDPSMCFFNKDQIRLHAEQSIENKTGPANDMINACDKNIKAHRKQCQSDGDFQAKCPLEKCQIPDDLKERVKTPVSFSTGINETKEMINVISSKMGSGNYYATMLMGAFSTKTKYLDGYPLYMQKEFNTAAIKPLINKMSEMNFKIDEEAKFSESVSSVYYYDKEKAKVMKSFQENVVTKMTKSSEKNLELVKAWAASESLEDTAIFKDLSETLAAYSKSVLRR